MNENPRRNNQLLTERQLQVVDLISKGFSNKEIAIDLKISEGTVKQHIFTIFRLLQVSTRAKLVIAAQRLAPSGRLRSKAKDATKKAPFSYSWRLIVAVAIAIKEVEISDPSEFIQRKKYLDQLRLSIEDIVFALDAKSMLLPDGGLLIWFGHPTSHIDDVDRAVLIAKAIRERLELDQAEKLKVNVGLGISTHTEIVTSDTNLLTAANAFQEALVLAKQSTRLNLILANLLTQQLCSAAVPWLELRPKGVAREDQTGKTKQNIYAIDAHHKESVRLSKWGELFFLKDIFQSVSNGVAQWICVDSWPPSVAKSLVDGIGLEATSAGFYSLKLHMPSSKRRDVILSSLLTQLEIVAMDFDLSSDKPDSTLDRFLSSIWKISAQVPLALEIFGIQSLQALKNALGERGIDRLVGLRVLVVVNDLRDIKKPQTSIRMLGPRPDNNIFTRIHSMVEPNLNLLPDGVLVDIQAMVDDLSTEARQMLFAAAQYPEKEFNELITSVNLPRPVLQSALQELVSSGLILPLEGQHHAFRDARTASAVRQLNISIPLSEINTS